MTAREYSVFEYLCRDAGNYKAWGELLLLGDLSPADLLATRTRFESGEFFIAEQIGVPSLYETLWKECDSSASDDDHVWHEFQAVRPATEHDVDALPVWGSAESLIEKISGVERWNESLSRNGKSRRNWKWVYPPERQPELRQPIDAGLVLVDALGGARFEFGEGQDAAPARDIALFPQGAASACSCEEQTALFPVWVIGTLKTVQADTALGSTGYRMAGARAIAYPRNE